MTRSGTLRRTLFAIAGLALAAPSLCFLYYSVRLIHVNLTASPEDAAAHRTVGMLVGAIAFPIAAFIFRLLSFFLFKRALPPPRS
ncbi:MAG: hypothetical protein ABJA02_06100 [Acidobacteriota bacterium]